LTGKARRPKKAFAAFPEGGALTSAEESPGGGETVWRGGGGRWVPGNQEQLFSQREKKADLRVGKKKKGKKGKRKFPFPETSAVERSRRVRKGAVSRQRYLLSWRPTFHKRKNRETLFFRRNIKKTLVASRDEGRRKQKAHCAPGIGGKHEGYVARGSGKKGGVTWGKGKENERSQQQKRGGTSSLDFNGKRHAWTYGKGRGLQRERLFELRKNKGQRCR